MVAMTHNDSKRVFSLVVFTSKVKFGNGNGSFSEEEKRLADDAWALIQANEADDLIELAREVCGPEPECIVYVDIDY